MKTVIIYAMLLAVVPFVAQAQKKGKAAKKNYTIVLLPDFYHTERPKHGDTTFGYDVYNHKHMKVNVDTATDINIIDEIHFTKSYFQRPPRGGEAISPPYLSAQLCNFERMNDTCWLVYNRVTREKYGLADRFKTIVRKDTVSVTDPETKVERNTIRQYYKTVQIPADAVPASHEH